MNRRLSAAELPFVEKTELPNRHLAPQIIDHNPKIPLSLLYSGNLGLAHDVETVAHAILHFHDNPSPEPVDFVFGGGSRSAWLQDFCETHEIHTPRFLPYCERHELPARPILFIGPKESTPALIVAEHNCGWQIDAGDVDGLVALLKHLSANRHRVAEAGARAYSAFRLHYTREIGVARIAALIAETESQPESTTLTKAAHV